MLFQSLQRSSNRTKRKEIEAKTERARQREGGREIEMGGVEKCKKRHKRRKKREARNCWTKDEKEGDGDSWVLEKEEQGENVYIASNVEPARGRRYRHALSGELHAAVDVLATLSTLVPFTFQETSLARNQLKK